MSNITNGILSPDKPLEDPVLDRLGYRSLSEHITEIIDDFIDQYGRSG